jgi:hypothetical protein
MDLLPFEVPFDIYGIIFGLMQGERDDALHLRRVLFVSRAWHAAAIHHPSLWTNIVIDIRFFEYFWHRPIEHHHQFLRHCLQRSGGLAFNLHLDFSSCLYWWRRATRANCPNEDFLHQLRTILEVLTAEDERHMRRCGSLHVSFENGLPCSILLSYFTLQLDRLEFLFLRNFEEKVDPLCNPLLPLCPSLKHVKLESNAATRPIVHGSSPQRLEMSQWIVWGSDDVAVIQRFSSISILKLESLSSKEFFHRASYVHSGEPQHPLIILHNLRTLELCGTLPEGLLKPLVAPNLGYLRICSHPESGLHAIGELLPCTVHTHAHTLDVELSTEKTYFWKGAYDALLGQMPRLENVKLIPGRQERSTHLLSAHSVIS